MARAKNAKGSRGEKSLNNPRQFPSYQAKLQKQEPLDRFLKAFSKWEPWIGGDLPTYSLPDELIELLGASEVRPKSLLTQNEVDAERAFGTLCRNWNKFCVGVWCRKPMCHYALSDFKRAGQPPSDNQESDTYSLTSEQVTDCQDQLFGIHPCDFVGRAKTLGYWGSVAIPSDSTDEIDFRLAARSCIGSLLCASEFVADTRRLWSLWNKLPANLQVPISDPLTNLDKLVLAPENKSQHLARACINFSIEYRRVLERWALAGFVTWDLPLIQPPLLGISLLEASMILPPSARVIYWPPHVQRPPTIDLNSALRALQQSESTFRLFDEGRAGTSWFPSVKGKQKGGKPSDNEKIAQMVLWERVLRQRYSGRRGGSTRFIEALQEHFAFSTSQGVKNLRRSYRRLFPRPARN